MSTHEIAQKPAHSQAFTSTEKVKQAGARSSAKKPQTSKTRSSKKSDQKSTLDTWISMPRAELDEV